MLTKKIRLELKDLDLSHPYVHVLYASESNPYTVLVFDPVEIIEASKISESNPFEKWKESHRKRTKSDSSSYKELPFFTSGWVGHISYEATQWIEPQVDLLSSPDSAPLFAFAAYDASICWSESSEEATLFAVSSKAMKRALLYLQRFLLTDYDSNHHFTAHYCGSDTSEEQFKLAVNQTKERILAGDIFQANITRRISAQVVGTNGSLIKAQVSNWVHEKIAIAKESYGAVLMYSNAIIASLSPECFFRIENTPKGKRVIASPIKGTRPRGKTDEQDQRLAQELLASEKDKAENVMIVDLVRNDLSKVCLDESVKCERLCALMKNDHVFHLVSDVEGILRPELDVIDALMAQFPCGSITGAPKWASMDAISAMEQQGRGVYCGAIGFIDDRGHADFSVAIRTAVFSFNDNIAEVVYGTGGGITTLSDAEEEYLETKVKANAFVKTFDL